MKNHKKVAPPTVGGSSLLTIFAVLCLTTFTLLALSTAQANKRLNDASVQAVSDYYAADFLAEEIFARLRQGDLPSEVLVNENIYTYTCTISDTQKLVVELKKEKEAWIVLRWQAISAIEQ
jgi:hypothetical protein